MTPQSHNIKREEISELEYIGLEYHYDTESYDRIHPHGISPSGESAMPINRGASSANAYLVRDEAVEKGARMGFTPQEVFKAIRDTARYKFEDICEILGRHYYPLKPRI